jgi:hypothetical protein
MLCKSTDRCTYCGVVDVPTAVLWKSTDRCTYCGVVDVPTAVLWKSTDRCTYCGVVEVYRSILHLLQIILYGFHSPTAQHIEIESPSLDQKVS